MHVNGASGNLTLGSDDFRNLLSIQERFNWKKKEKLDEDVDIIKYCLYRTKVERWHF